LVNLTQTRWSVECFHCIHNVVDLKLSSQASRRSGCYPWETHYHQKKSSVSTTRGVYTLSHCSCTPSVVTPFGIHAHDVCRTPRLNDDVLRLLHKAFSYKLTIILVCVPLPVPYKSKLR